MTVSLLRGVSLFAIFVGLSVAVADLRAQNPSSPQANPCPPTTVNTIDVTPVTSTYRAVNPSPTPSNFFSTGQNADVLLSGIDFNATGGSQLFNHPGGLATNGTNLVVTDTFNNRVLIWNTAPAANAAPDVVLGQADFTTNNPGTGRNQMNWPMSVAIAAGKLFVTDTNNHRILIWNSMPSTNNVNADVIINAPAMGSFQDPWPWGVWSDGTKMVVSATSAGKIHIWNAVPTVDNTAPSFTLNTTGTVGTPRHITSNGTMLIVGDHNASVPGSPMVGSFFWNTFPANANSTYSFFRPDPLDTNGGPWMKGSFIDGALWAFGRGLYKWNAPPSVNTTPPDLVLADYDFLPGDYGGVARAGGRLYVASGNLNKIVGYNALPASSGTTPDFAVGSSGVCTNTLDTNFFIQNGVPRSNGQNLFVSSDFDRKLYVWRTLPDQSNAHPDLYYRLPFQPWASALRGNTYVLAGERTVYIWETLPLQGEMPARQLRDTIGSVSLQNVKGVALDATYFYLADEQADRIYVWNALPQSATNPLFSINVPDPQRINSDGTYLVVTTGPSHAVRVYDVASLNASSSPLAIVGGVGTFNLPMDAHVASGRLFVADTGFSRVHAWSSVANAIAGSPADVVLGESNTTDRKPEIGRNKAFWPGSVWFDGRFLWVGEFKFSTRLMRFSPNCSYHALSATTATASSAGGSGSLTVSPYGDGCAWTASSNAGWISITAGASGNGAGTVGYSVAANTSTSARSGTITVAGQTFTVTQSGVSCTYSRTPSTSTFATSGGNGSVDVTASSSACAWSITNPADWIQISGGTDRTGSATVNFSVAANAAGAPRTASLTLAGQSFLVLQSSAAPPDERIAFGLTSIASAGGWMSVRSGSGGSYGAKPWAQLPWPSYNATGKGTHVAAGDVDGDGRDELVVGLESGGAGWIAVLDDAASSHALLSWIQVPWSTYNAANGEVWPAVGDVDNDGKAEIVAGLGNGAGGWFAIFDDGAASYALIGWRRVGWATYNAGDGRTYPAVGNIDGTGAAEIVLGLGPGSNGWIEIFTSSSGNYAHRDWIQVPWPTYNAQNGETHVAAGDVDGDGRAEIVAGLGTGGYGWVHVFDDASASYASAAWLRTSWSTYNLDGSRGQTFPAVGDVDGDPRAEIVVGLGAYPNAGGWFEVWDDTDVSYVSLGWRNVGWSAFTAAGGGLFPAVGRFR